MEAFPPMAVIALFDKSFLQSLNVDESVWFDHFFMPVICPIFYVETLSDLAKEQRGERTPEAIVRAIAEKFPEKSGSPCISHTALAVHNLLGADVPMDGRIPRPGGRHVQGGGKKGVVFDRSEEEEAFTRWQQEEFREVERMFAAKWRAELNGIDLGQIPAAFTNVGFDPKLCKTFEEARDITSRMVRNYAKSFEMLRFATLFLGVPSGRHPEVIARWKAVGKPSLSRFAPYAAFVLEIETFFHVAIAANLISFERNSNRTDIAYLFYLPFCQVFVSGDKLHRNTASLFFRADQEFVWGPDLKADLRCINEHFLTLPDEVRDQGLFKFAHHPPKLPNSVVLDLWKHHLRPGALTEPDMTDKLNEEGNAKLVADLKAFTKGKAIPANKVPDDDEAIEMLSVERRMCKRKGSWWQVPKNLPDEPDE
jgi:hypothetical protein